jgi:hypothetical protein
MRDPTPTEFKVTKNVDIYDPSAIGIAENLGLFSFISLRKIKLLDF